ncbi:unnamed protein product, partial [Rotaria socialis]
TSQEFDMGNSHSDGQAELCCCVPVTYEEIDHETLVHVKRIRWNGQYNRGYCTENCTKINMTATHTYWKGRLASSPERFPYYVPSSWFRLSVQVDTTCLPDWGPNWHTLYHGTDPRNIHKIIENGFRVRECQHGFPALYLSPSIQYCSHPRYARVISHKSMFFQFVLEVRVDIRKLQPLKKRETLEVGVKGDIDPNFPNNEDLEFLLRAQEGKFIKSCEGVVVTGVMVRKINFDPALLPSSWWWCKWRTWVQIHHYYYNSTPKLEKHTQ